MIQKKRGGLALLFLGLVASLKETLPLFNLGECILECQFIKVD